jgi:hypothetical protein
MPLPLSHRSLQVAASWLQMQRGSGAWACPEGHMYLQPRRYRAGGTRVSHWCVTLSQAL